MIHGVYSLIILAVSVVLLLCSLYLQKKITRSYFVPSICNYFMFTFLIYIYFGSVVLNIADFGLVRHDLLFTTWIYSSLFLVLFPLGMLGSRALLGVDVSRFSFHLKNDQLLVRPRETGGGVYLFLLTVLVIGFWQLWVYRTTLGGLPIESVFGSNSSAELGILRSNATNNFGGQLYRIDLFMRIAPLFILIYSYFAFSSVNGSIKGLWRLLYIASLLFLILVSISTLQKAPIVKLVLLLFILDIFRHRHVRKGVLIGVSIVIPLLVIFMYIYFMNKHGRSFDQLFMGFVQRSFLGQVKPFYFWQLYIEEHGYLWGASLPNPGGILPFENVRITQEVMKFAFPRFSEMGIVGSMPTVFYADWLANFTPIGAVFSMLFLGFFYQSLDILLLRKWLSSKRLVVLSFYFFVVYYFARYAGTSIFGLLFDVRLFLVLILALCIWCATLRKNRIAVA